MQPITDALNALFDRSGSFLPYLVAVAGLGVLSMALLQAAKNLTPMRRWFQRYRMRAWLSAHGSEATTILSVPADPVKAERQIVLLATDGDECAFYDLEIDKLCGQWNAATQIAMDYPRRYPDLLACMAARSIPEDFDKVMRGDYPDPLPPSLEAALPADEQKQRMDRRQSFIDARTRVTNQVQRAIDSFQISTAFRWQWLLQLASFVLSFGLAAFAMCLTGSFQTGTALIGATLAAFLAPVARDLVAAIQKLRS